MADLQENKYKFDSGSPIGCGLAIVVFIFAIISLNAEMFTNMSNWDLKNYADGTKYKDTTFFWFHQYFNMPSLIIVILGTITALIISLPLDRISNVPKILTNIWKTENWSYMDVIEQICSYAAIARKSGTYALDKDVQNLPSGYMKDWLDLMITERDPVKLKTYMFTEMANVSIRHKNGADFFKKGEKYAPSFGMMGTVMGLIVMMNGFDLDGKDLSTVMTGLLGGMGTALITTLYGVLLANFIFGPIAGKLETLSSIEVRHRTVMMEGIMSIHSLTHPIIIRERLMTFVPAAEKELEVDSKE
ncbi:MAG: hypothetical protein CMG55_00560 [Candidatus Marinimicrobia bacterium]|nr:hypothetical protein [Candidatus Neomarinimicrobiota bacterium]|tara:strand:- start:712 stop:1620 length:909 start_codon:yes stop_codon:yes gene_type:complete